MKLSKEDLIAKINERVTDEDVAIELMEDVTDSFESESDDTELIESLQNEISELKQKYKERFLKGESKGDDPDDDEPATEEVIDIKEI